MHSSEPSPADPMRILVIAPQPYFIERGSPIDVDLLVRALSHRRDAQVDLLVYPEGEDRSHPGCTLHRSPGRWLVRGVRPGFSVRKVLADVLLAFSAWRLVHRNHYDVIHAVEETAFLGLFFRYVYGIPYVYDLDSSLAQQMVEQMGFLSPLVRALDRCEALVIRGALAAAPVCNALRDLCQQRGARKVFTLYDISQLEKPDAPRSGVLRRETGSDRLMLLYVGNLEPYQGVDLLLDAFARAAPRTEAIDLTIIGGRPDDVAAYRARVAQLGVGDRVHLLGPRPLTQLDRYLADADVLVAPRIRGVNTPMKVFPYLHSGRPVLVTDLPTHSQVLTPDVALLAPAEPEGFANAIVRLAEDAGLRERLGKAGRAFAEANHTFPAHQRRVDELYDFVAQELRTA